MKLYGKNSVVERLRANPASVRKVFLQHGYKGTLAIHRRTRQSGISVMPIPQSKMMKIGRDKNTQGIMADVEDFVYTPYDEVLETAGKKKRSILFLDGLTDPQNLGAIIRSLACLGRFSIVLPTHDSVSVTEAVLRVASGGENYVPVARVANLGNAIKKAKEEGIQILGAVVQGGQSLGEVAMSFPVGFVIGSERSGIRDVIARHIDVELSIPMGSDTMSFNAAHAATVFAYEITRQKKSGQKTE